MTPYYADDWLTVYLGDCREVMAAMEPESVHCVVTSPPYWGLRDYGIGGQLGLEPTPDAYVASMVAVFREVRRVLRKDGTVWLNLGDSFGKKQLQGVPWRVAFALQADGWYLRSDIIWSKPNPMPESVTDRPTKAHEYVFLLSKSARYFYDADAVREAAEYGRRTATYDIYRKVGTAAKDVEAVKGTVSGSDPSAGRNLRSVWTIATQPYPGAHFATFPRALVEPCIKAGTSEKGVCPECGAPWERVVVISRPDDYDPSIEAADPKFRLAMAHRGNTANSRPLGEIFADSLGSSRETTGWRPACVHGTEDRSREPWDPIPATVLDPFAGSGTTGLVAQSLSRRAVLIDLSGEYLKQLMDRNRDIPLGLAGG